MDKLCFDTVITNCATLLREIAPKDTGNLAYNAVLVRYEDSNTVKLYVNEVIAPYMPYTNEPWISPRWGGKKNPNEGWFDRAAEALAQRIATMCGGTLQRKDNNS